MNYEPSPFGGEVIASAIEVHRHLGPGLLESAYEKCLMHEFYLRGIHVQRQRNLPITYKGVYLDYGYRVDFIIDDALVVEVKTVDKLLPIHRAQLLTYQRLLQIRHGLILNFNVRLMRDGIWSVICPIANVTVDPPDVLSGDR